MLTGYTYKLAEGEQSVANKLEDLHYKVTYCTDELDKANQRHKRKQECLDALKEELKKFK